MKPDLTFQACCWTSIRIIFLHAVQGLRVPTSIDTTTKWRTSSDDGVTSCQRVLQSAGFKPFTGTPVSSYWLSGAVPKGSVYAGVTVMAAPKVLPHWGDGRSRAQWEDNSRVWRKSRMHQVTLLPLDRESTQVNSVSENGQCSTQFWLSKE